MQMTGTEDIIENAVATIRGGIRNRQTANGFKTSPS